MHSPDTATQQDSILGKLGWRLERLGIGLALLAFLALLLAPPHDPLDKADRFAYAVCHRLPGHSFTIGGRQLPLCARCSGTYLGALAGLAAHHGPSFAEVACAVKGKTRHYVATSPEGMIAPAQIPGTGLWAETNQSAKSVVRVVGKLLQAFGHTAADFAVDLAG